MKQFRLILILWLCMAMNAKANETTANLLQQGDSCLSRYDVFHATQYYQKYLEANPSHLGARRKLASCYRKVGNYTACISCLDKIPSDSINHEDMRMFYYAYLNQNNNDKVSLWGERIAFLFPYDSEIIASLAVHYNGANKPDRAEKVAKNYISQCDSTNLYVNKEYAYSCNSNTMRLYPCMRN
jgi:tetratricopeptide (TPR) repeat protein